MRWTMKLGTLLGAGLGLAGCVGAPVAYPGYGSAYPGSYAPSPYAPGPYAPPGYAAVPPAAPAPARTVAQARPRPRPAAPATGAYAAKVPDGAATPAAAAGAPECRSVTELSYVDGKEVRQEQRYCRTPPSREWVKS